MNASVTPKQLTPVTTITGVETFDVDTLCSMQRWLCWGHDGIGTLDDAAEVIYDAQDADRADNGVDAYSTHDCELKAMQSPLMSSRFGQQL